MRPGGTEMRKIFRIIKIILFLAVLGGGGWFIYSTLSRSSTPPAVAVPPEVAKVPERVYGVVEPAGREVYVSSSVSKPVRGIFIKEGDRVKMGQVLIALENEVELAQLQSALAKVELKKKELEISRYELSKKRTLFEKETVPEFEYTQLKLKAELAELEIQAAEREVALAGEQVNRLELRSPIDGIVYKMEVRLGELLNSGDRGRIILGSPELWVRLYVESFWMDRFKEGDRFDVFNSETNSLIGQGEVIRKSLYLSTRNFRADDIGERFDAEFQQVVLKLEPRNAPVPLGLNVIVRGGRSPKGHP
jgi:multidrug efflux pump subunit AcrA (membrane-fusion protein)